jgi:ABC-2 type transport system permease protein
MSLAATYRLGTHLFWRDKAMFFVSVVLPLGLAVGLPALMRHVTDEGQTAATALSQSMIAIPLSITAFMNTCVALTTRRDQLVLKRLRSTELTDRQILLGQISSVATQAVVIVVVCTVAARFAAGVPLPPDPLAFAALTIAGSAVMALLGAAFSAAVPRPELAALYAGPVYLLCGVSAGALGPIPLPSWLQATLDLLPSTAVVNAVKSGEPGVPFLILGAWAVAGLLALRLWFRWEPRRS